MRRRPHLLLLLALGTAAACERPRVQITPVYEVKSDAGVPLDCAVFDDLACVNFIKFQIEEEGNLTPPTDCITVDKRLTNLCDVTKLAHGSEIFRYDMDARVKIRMYGLRVFPATSCEIVPDCPPKSLFEGTSDEVKLSSSGELPLHVNFAKGCGAKEVYRPRIGGRDCFSVCDFSEPVCDMRDGCVCLLPDARTDAGVPDGVGAL